MRIAFVGLGAMGRGMVGNLLKAGHEVSGYDVDASALDWLERRGGRRAGSAALAADGAEALVLMVVNAQQARAALFGEEGAIQGLPGGALVIAALTMPEAETVSICETVESAGLNYLDAPVSGGASGADAGTLTFMAAGSDAAWNAGKPLLDVMGDKIYRLGDKAGPGSVMKMVHQLAAGCNLAVAAEVMSFGAHLGLDPAQVLEVLRVSAGGSWMIDNRGPRMMTEGVEAKSSVEIFVKDLGIVLDAARAARFPVPVSASALQVFMGASLAGYGKHDDSQAVRFYESLGGRPVRKPEE